MRLLKTGKENPPAVNINQTLFVDMWDNWALYEDYNSTFDQRIQKFVEYRKSQTHWFNPNYIRQFIRKR
jgi:hypothetical protein